MKEIINQKLVIQVAQESENITQKQVRTVIDLLEEGNTIPFIARYRKEMTGSLDEVQIKTIEDRYQYLCSLEEKKADILKAIEDQGKLTDSIKADISKAVKLQQLEDIYRPFKQKKKTKAGIAKEQGLEPFAQDWLACRRDFDVLNEARHYLNEAVSLSTVEEVIQGAHEIVAEQVGDQPQFREWIRKYTRQHGVIVSEVKDEALDERHVYEMYYSFSQAIKTMTSHRVLAINRGEKEGILKVKLEVNDQEILALLNRKVISDPQAPAADYIAIAITDSYKRFIKPAIERELRNELSEMAHTQAIAIFGENLRHLLLQPPLKGRVVLGFDPAYRTGCKLAIVDSFGKVLHIDVIYPHDPASRAQKDQAKLTFIRLLNQYQVDTIAIGNGTASRESEEFVAACLQDLDHPVYYVIVNEAGASVYSASAIAREEFPDLQVEQRSAVSIARRLQDPLAELVKIDAKAVGVGQYQHDVNQKQLEVTLDFVVETAVNQVGVNLNTSSIQLLEHVAGLTPVLAKNIYAYRQKNGAFMHRSELLSVPRLGDKAYQQAVGFLRIPTSDDILENTGVHPEQYPLARMLMQTVKDTSDRDALIKTAKSHDWSEEGYGEETIKDVIEAISAPGRDMRDTLPAPVLKKDVMKMEDIKTGMKLQGTVRNVVDFGAFVDIGVKQDGLVHLSRMKEHFVKHPTDVVSVGDIVDVWVIDVDLKKQRIQLSMVAPKGEKHD